MHFRGGQRKTLSETDRSFIHTIKISCDLILCKIPGIKQPKESFPLGEPEQEERLLLALEAAPFEPVANSEKLTPCLINKVP